MVYYMILDEVTGGCVGWIRDDKYVWLYVWADGKRRLVKMDYQQVW